MLIFFNKPEFLFFFHFFTNEATDNFRNRGHSSKQEEVMS